MDKLIDLMIIGAQKAGTTSLKNYLGEHPRICTHHSVEFTYFEQEEFYENGFEHNFQQFFEKKKNLKDCKIIAKHVQTHFRDHVFEKMKKHNPDMQIIFILRNPVDRAYSSYLMAKQNGWMKKEFEQVKNEIELERGDMYYFFIRLGFYYQQLKQIHKYFDSKNVSVILYEDLKNTPQEVCETIFERLQVDSKFKPNTQKVHNKRNKIRSKSFNHLIKYFKSEKKPLKKAIRGLLPYQYFIKLTSSIESLNHLESIPAKLDMNTRQYLLDFYLPYSQELEKYLKMDFSNWNY